MKIEVDRESDFSSEKRWIHKILRYPEITRIKRLAFVLH